MHRLHLFMALLLVTCSVQGDVLAVDDLVIKNATIYDGSGSPAMTGHVAVRAGKITSVGPGDGPKAKWVIDATGLVVAPGFIDLHTHSDSPVIAPSTRACVNYLLQGCTTSVTGNCGSGKLEVGSYYDQIDLAGAGTNVAHLFPQGTMRRQVIGTRDRKPTPEEMDKMRQMVRRAMEEGAWGMSTGLIYSPGVFTTTEELIEMAKVVAEYDGIYASHIRGEDANLLPAIQEAIQIGEEAGCPAHISHLKAAGLGNWGSMHVVARIIEDARARGIRVTADQYPYTALSTSLEPILFPGWARSGGRAQLVARLDDPETGPKVREQVAVNLVDTDDGDHIVITNCRKHPEYVGKSLKQIAAAEGLTSLEVAEKIVKAGGATIISFTMSDEDVRKAMTFPWVATSSDASSKLPSSNRPHPRAYGTFPRKIGHYSIREGVLPLEKAIRSSTGLPAEILGLSDRGYLKPDYAADIVVFDPEKLIDRATYDEPYRYAQGMVYVFVNGTPAVHEGVPTGALAGKALRKLAAKSADNSTDK